MDILYISPQTAKDLTMYCESNLLREVMEDFAQNAQVINKDNETHPSRWWIVTDYISNQTIESRKKLAVILSFAKIGGFVQIGERQELGYDKVLYMLRKLHYISDADLNYFVDAFSRFSQGNGVKFS